MSFFIKSKKGKNISAKQPTPNGKRKRENDDEITSSESDDEIHAENNVSEDEAETAQDKRLRLAKVYLEEIAKEEQTRLENENVPDDVVSSRLKEDYLKQTGKFRATVADLYTGADVKNIKFLKSKEHRSAVTCLCISSDNKYAFSGSKNAEIVKWSLFENKKLGSIRFKKKNAKNNSNVVEGNSSSIICIAISDDFKFLAVGEKFNEIQVWNPETLEHLHTLKGHRSHVTGLVFRKNSHQLYSCSRDKTVKVWSLDEMAYLETLFGHQDCIMAIDALSRERAVTAGGADSTLRIWKIAEESQLIFNGTGNVDCVKLMNEENFISGGDTGELCVWSSIKKKPLCVVKEAHGRDAKLNHVLWITSLATLLNTDLIASGSSDGFIRLWKVHDGHRAVSPLFTIAVTGYVNALSFSSDGNYLVAAIGQEHRCGRWNTIKESKNGVIVIPLLKKDKNEKEKHLNKPIKKQ